MNREEFLSNYWRHYLILEDDFLKTIRYVELHVENYNTFSVEYGKQYQSICSEIDVICKSICLFIDDSSKAKKMPEYTPIILEQYSDIVSRKVLLKINKQLVLSPYKEWSTSPKYTSPSWWSSYNDVKHNRVGNFEKANLENIINSLAGLFLLEMYFLKEICSEGIDIPDKNSALFKIQDWETRCESCNEEIYMEILQN